MKLDKHSPTYAYDNEEKRQQAKALATSMYRYDNLAVNRLAKLEDITDEQVLRFWNEGYLVIDQAFTPEEVSIAIAALMDIVYGKTDKVKVQFVRSQEGMKTERERELAARKVYSFYEKDERLTSLALKPEVLEAIQKLYGEGVRVVQDMAILKPPTGGAEKPWHQDMAYGPLCHDKPVIGTWTALDPAELDNGCMHVIPYSHREGGVPHYAVRDWQLCDVSVRVDQDVVVPLAPGGMLIFHGLLHHGTPPNFSEKRRRAMQIHYARESAVRLSPTEYKRMFTNELTGAEC